MVQTHSQLTKHRFMYKEITNNNIDILRVEEVHLHFVGDKVVECRPDDLIPYWRS